VTRASASRTKKRKKRLTGIGTHVGAMCPIRPNALWALDFQFDTTIDGRTLKMLNVIDEFTRECLAIEVDRSIDADGVVAVLDRLALERGGPPAFVRLDNGPEFVATRSLTGADSTAPTACSSTRARRGRTRGSSRSTAACATSCSTAGSSTRCSRPA
jgi:transposase InsO family protein